MLFIVVYTDKVDDLERKITEISNKFDQLKLQYNELEVEVKSKIN